MTFEDLLDRAKRDPLTYVAVAAALAAGIYFFLGGFDGAPLDDGGGEPITPVDQGDPMGLDPRLVNGPVYVVHRERANGVDQRLQDFLDWWGISGPFQICVCPNGGLRTDSALQLSFFNAGTSGAADLSQTPHGRGGAIDVAPYFNFAPQWNGQAGAFAVIQQAAIAQGLVSGRSWGDGDHLEVPGWKSLPYPPPSSISNS